MSKKFSQIDFLNNLEYILINLENDKEKANSNVFWIIKRWNN